MVKEQMMAYDYFVCKVSNAKEINRKQKVPKYWFNGRQQDFKNVIFAGDIDMYALYTQKELLELASKYDKDSYRKPDSIDSKALEYINSFDDSVFLVSAIWWESGLG